MDLTKIGACLRDLRKEKGLTQEQLAEQLNVSQRTVSRWETGSNTPDLDILLQLADFYEVDLRALLNGEIVKEKMSPEAKETMMEAEKYSRTKYKSRKRALIVLLAVAAAAIVLLLSFIVLSNYYNINRIPITPRYAVPFFEQDHVCFGDPPKKVIPDIPGTSVERRPLVVTDKTLYSYKTTVMGEESLVDCFFWNDRYLTSIDFLFFEMEEEQTKALFDHAVQILQDEYQDDPNYFCDDLIINDESNYRIGLGLSFGATGIFYTVGVSDNILSITCDDLY